jgi:hypothetical protein
MKKENGMHLVEKLAEILVEAGVPPEKQMSTLVKLLNLFSPAENDKAPSINEAPFMDGQREDRTAIRRARRLHRERRQARLARRAAGLNGHGTPE